VVGSATTPPRKLSSIVQVPAPKHLTARSKRIFRQIIADYDLSSEPHALEILGLALEAHGMTYVDRFGAPRQRPEIAIERDSRLAVARLFRELSLDAADYTDPRPPRIGSGAMS
jgi:hypothetical protein